MGVNETVWACHRDHENGFLLKVDFEKAFDSIGWNFVLSMLEARGFSALWIAWIRQVLDTESSILINGSVGLSFRHKRGVRQGNPISPFIFNLAVDCLSRLLSLASRNGLIEGVLSSRVEGGVTHFLFADDLMIFCSNKDGCLRNVMFLMKCFEITSGLKINLAKTEVVSLRGDRGAADQAAQLIGCHSSVLPLSYLGLPLRAGRPIRADWLRMIGKLDARLSSWQGKLLSRAGRLVLINSTISSLVAYLWSVFKVPGWVVNMIDKKRRKFFWSGTDATSSGRCLVRWDSITRPLEAGGLGILELRSHCSARRGGWIWKVMLGKSLLWVRLMDSLYGDFQSWNGANFLRKASPVWKDLRHLFEVMRLSSSFIVGDGRRIKLWTDCWANGECLAERFPSLFNRARLQNCSIFEARSIDPSGVVHWNIPFTSLVEAGILLQLGSALEAIKYAAGEDTFRWKWSSDGVFSARSLYRMLMFVHKDRLPTKARVVTKGFNIVGGKCTNGAA
ncbi:hypothetical protein Cni_G11423 [Canna indica]|uniref:Reverse transcriptase domain-containing protein n=1 Tax=Canna indica TaxID=4628 RepID=A0AAQ3K7S0_9LILI|nr:hypothetical protein Cni_G11423 [Canna indica]